MAEKSLEDKFKEAAESVKTMQFNKTVPTDRKLKLYAFYKQANEGDNSGARPGMFSWEARSKFDAWEAVKGKDKESCMREYIEELEAQIREFKD
mmetsp:Transcript_69804/g.193244  ORF Transcript_69804/g.193244 Transcript_69804/m.193244 type:complete len:94 (+) Transcript_69804:83-364(+)